MRFVLLSIMSVLCLFATQDIEKKWETNENCEACHMNISSKWETSRHSRSHFSENDLFKKTLMYMVKQEPRFQLDELKVTCAKCHNPRLTQKSITQEDKYLLLMDLDHVNKEYNQKLNTKNMKNGINCIVCHNIDKIHLDKSKGSEGMHNITFGPQGTMYGPFGDADSPYHKTQKRDHFLNDDPKLCFTCHYSGENYLNIEVYATGKEYDAQQSVEGCKNCHMSEKRKGVASNYSKAGEKPKERMVREHRFASVDNSNILNDYVDVKSSSSNGKFILKVTNNTPHNIPTGYGLRELILKVKYFDKKDKQVGNDEAILGIKWRDKNGKYTIPHMATLKVEDTRLEGKSSKEYSFEIPEGAKYAKYTFSYRLIDEHMANEIGITDEFFLKEYTFSEQRVHL